MNSGQSSTKLNDMLTEFVNYVYSFYGATEKYLSLCADPKAELCTWGDGDSLDRERVRDILLDEYNLEIKEWN